MGQGMTKQQKQICSAQFSATSTGRVGGRPYDRNSYPVVNETSATQLRHPIATLSVNYVESNRTDQTFSSISAQKFMAYSGSQSHRLPIPSCDSSTREASCGGNSSSHAEGKHDFFVNKTKTPRLGIHMKSLNNCPAKKSNSPPTF